RALMAVRAQQDTRFVLRLQQMLMIDREAREIHAAARTPDLKICLDRNDDEVILRLPEDGSLGFRQPHDLERKTLDYNGFPDHLPAGKELLLQVVPEARHVHVALVLDFGDESSLLRFIV